VGLICGDAEEDNVEFRKMIMSPSNTAFMEEEKILGQVNGRNVMLA
jgi:hypothetical protein